MKKIISALALGAMAIGLATADMSIGINYRNGIEAFKYVNTGVNGRSTDDYGNTFIDSGYDKNGATYNLFNLTGWNAGKDDVSLKASGKIFNFAATLQPSISNNNIVFQIMRVGAEVGNFYFNAGWTGNGLMNYRVSRFGNNGNEESKVAETYKLGSIFKDSEGLGANNQVGFNAGSKNLFAYVGYSFIFSDRANMMVQAAYLSDREIGNISVPAWKNYPGWSLFFMPKIKKVFDGEFFIKGHMDANEKQTLVIGGYGRPLVLPMIADGGIGGSVVIKDGNLMEYNFDVRLLFEFGDRLELTTMTKFAKLVSNKDTGYNPTDGAAVGALAGLTGFKSSQSLWSMLGARYKLNKTITLIGTLGGLVDLDKGFQSGRESADGAQIYFHPHAQFYANGKISVVAGVLAAFGGIGADSNANKDVDMIINVPVLIRVKL